MNFYVITYYNPSSFIISKMSMYVGPTHTEAPDNTIEFINPFGPDHVGFDLYLLVKLGKWYINISVHFKDIDKTEIWFVFVFKIWIHR